MTEQPKRKNRKSGCKPPAPGRAPWPGARRSSNRPEAWRGLRRPRGRSRPVGRACSQPLRAPGAGRWGGALRWPAGLLIIAPGASPAGPPCAANLGAGVRRPGPSARPTKKSCVGRFFLWGGLRQGASARSLCRGCPGGPGFGAGLPSGACFGGVSRVVCCLSCSRSRSLRFSPRPRCSRWRRLGPVAPRRVPALVGCRLRGARGLSVPRAVRSRCLGPLAGAVLPAASGVPRPARLKGGAGHVRSVARFPLVRRCASRPLGAAHSAPRRIPHPSRVPRSVAILPGLRPRKKNLEQKGVFQMLTQLELEYLISRDIGPDWSFVYSYRAFEGGICLIITNVKTRETMHCAITDLSSGSPRLVRFWP